MDQRPNRYSRYSSLDGFINPGPSNRPPIPKKIAYPNPPPVRQILSNKPQNTNMAQSSEQKQFQRYYSPYAQNSNQAAATPKPKKHWSKKRKILTPILIILILFVGLSSYFGYNLLSSLDRVFHGNVFSDIHSLFSTTELKGESTGRVNILLAGYQGKQSDEGALTDSIMVVSLDTENNTAFTYSIPRDLWLNIPGIGYSRINAANTVSNFSQPGYFRGGMGQLQEVVENDLGIPIDYYALIDYTAFEDAVNAVGGITVNIQSPDPRGLYDPNVNKAHGGPLKLPNGPVHLNGLSALALALARGDSPYAYGFPLSDINRTQHQRQMLIALEQKASNIGVLSNPITITNLVNAVSNNVKTDLTLPDILELAHLAKALNKSDIGSYGLSYGGTDPLLQGYNASGQDVLIPTAGIGNFSQIQNYYQQITSNNPVVRENASVAILNGSNKSGLTKTEQAALQAKGVNNVAIGNASTEYPGTMIIDLAGTKDPNTLKLLQQMFPGTTTSSDTSPAEATEAQAYSSYKFIVVLGQNWDNAS